MTSLKRSLKKMKPFAVLLLCLGLLGCASDNSQFKTDLDAFSSADVIKSTNTLLVGKAFPVGNEVGITNSQARQLQEILSHAKNAPGENSAEGILISPAPALCSLTIAGTTWYFMPPSEPRRFRLPSEHQKKFERILTEEFGLR